MNKFEELGKYLGYPDCCIKDFIFRVNNLTNPQLDAEEPRKLHGTGYVPCPDCNLKSEDELKKVIASNRKCPTAFPIYRPVEDDEFQEVAAWHTTFFVENKKSLRFYNWFHKTFSKDYQNLEDGFEVDKYTDSDGQKVIEVTCFDDYFPTTSLVSLFNAYDSKKSKRKPSKKSTAINPAN